MLGLALALAALMTLTAAALAGGWMRGEELVVLVDGESVCAVSSEEELQQLLGEIVASYETPATTRASLKSSIALTRGAAEVLERAEVYESLRAAVTVVTEET
ncbi:MAG: hypothetical protein ACSW8F_06630, partial [bacterium]